MSCKTFPEALTLIAKKFGKGKLHNRSFVIACLKDLLPEQKAARKVLDAAFAIGVAEKFDEACGDAVNKQQMVLSQCSMQLCSDHGFQKELVEDVLWAYGIAMGFTMPEPYQKKARPVPKPPLQVVPSPQPSIPKQPLEQPPQPLLSPQVPSSRGEDDTSISLEIEEAQGGKIDEIDEPIEINGFPGSSNGSPKSNSRMPLPSNPQAISLNDILFHWELST